VIVTVYNNPVANAGPDQFVTGQTTAQLDGAPINNNETGLWSVISGTAEFSDPSSPKTTVNDLSENKNLLAWEVRNGVCAPSIDTLMITVHSHVIPTLITPNMDGKNDYLVIKGFKASEKIELVVFDRRGVQVFRNENYDNKWNGVDLSGKPLDNDTYFYTIKSNDNVSLSGYVMIKQ
jgi:gliding motility-associated-like protein